jgi:hypothetical protein
MFPIASSADQLERGCFRTTAPHGVADPLFHRFDLAQRQIGVERAHLARDGAHERPLFDGIAKDPFPLARGSRQSNENERGAPHHSAFSRRSTPAAIPVNASYATLSARAQAAAARNASVQPLPGRRLAARDLSLDLLKRKLSGFAAEVPR